MAHYILGVREGLQALKDLQWFLKKSSLTAACAPGAQVRVSILPGSPVPSDKVI